MAKDTWKTVVIVLVSVTAGFCLAGSGLLSRADAVSEGQTQGVIALMGDVSANNAPIVLVDVPDQTVLVYEYSYQNDRIELTSARTFRYDKLLQDWETDGPTVEQVRQAVQSQREAR